jgi:hypothetical protein
MESSLLSATKTHNFFFCKNCVFKEDHNVLDTEKLYLILKLCVFAFEKMNLSKKLPLNVYFNVKFLLFLCYKRFLSSKNTQKLKKIHLCVLVSLFLKKIGFAHIHVRLS